MLPSIEYRIVGRRVCTSESTFKCIKPCPIPTKEYFINSSSSAATASASLFLVRSQYFVPRIVSLRCTSTLLSSTSHLASQPRPHAVDSASPPFLPITQEQTHPNQHASISNNNHRIPNQEIKRNAAPHPHLISPPPHLPNPALLPRRPPPQRWSYTIGYDSIQPRGHQPRHFKSPRAPLRWRRSSTRLPWSTAWRAASSTWGGAW